MSKFLSRLYDNAAVILVSLIIAAFLPATTAYASPPNDWIISGKSVYIDDSKAYISVSPHTLASSGWVEVTFKSKQYSGDIDFAFGFKNNDKATVSQLQVWRNTEHIVKVPSIVSESIEQTFYSLTSYKTLTPGSVIADVGNQYNTKLIRIFSPEYPTGFVVAYTSQVNNGSDITFTLFVDSIIYNDQSVWYNDWSQVNKPVNKVTYSLTTPTGDSVDTWYSSQLDFNVVVGTEYKGRFWVELPWKGFEGTGGKYFVAFKPHSETLSQAKAAGHLYYLDPWWNSQWLYRRQLSFNASALTENLGNFTVTVFLNTNRVDFAKIATNGTDIRFVDKDDVTQLPYHITQWNAGINATIVVKVPQIDQLSNYTDSIYMYYGNPGASDAQNKNSVWTDTGAVGVWPLYTVENNSNNITDSTSYSNNGVNTGSLWTSQGRSFDGLSNFITVPHNTIFNTTSSGLTIIGWGEATDLLTERRIATKQKAAAPFDGFVLGFSNATASLQGYYRDISANTRQVDDVIHYSTNLQMNHETIVVGNATGVQVGRNGVIGATGSTVGFGYTTTTANLFIGKFRDASGYLKGSIGEVRIFNRTLSSQELKYLFLSEEYLWIGIDGLFIRYGAEESGIPTDFTITRVGISTVYVNWTVGSINPLYFIRISEDKYPEVNTGWPEWTGTHGNVTITGLTLSSHTYFIRAWVQSSVGTNTTIGEGFLGGEDMQTNMLLVTFLLLGFGLFVLCLWKKIILLSIGTTIMWLGLLIWFYLDSTPILGLNSDPYIYFTYVFLILSFIPLLNLMDTEITMEANGQRWVERGSRPQNKPQSAYEKYKIQLRGRTRR